MNRLTVIIAIAFGTLLAVSCGSDDDDDIIINRPKLGKYESRLEVPALQPSGTFFIQHSTKIGNDSVMTFCLEYNPSKNHSRWVAFRFDGKTRAKKVSRPDPEPWADDPKLDSYHHVGAGYFSVGSRGHLCASHDRAYSTEANKQTFYMTNMSPMNGSFNAYYWTAFENYINDTANGIGRNANFADTLYVVKGGTINNGMTQGTSKSSLGKSIVIPKYYFIALLRFKGGHYSALGFWVEHKNYGNTKPNIANNIVNIDRLEELTGIDFFHNLPDNIERQVESEDIETLRDVWGLNT